jgi:hypothetical protein
MPYLYTRIKYASWQEKFVLGMYPPPEEKYSTLHGEYKYEFPGTARQADPVLEGMKTTIQGLEVDDIVMANTRITVYNLTQSPPIWPRDRNTNINVKMYAFKTWRYEFPSAVPISIAQYARREILCPENILARENGEWIPFPEWVKKFAQNRFGGDCFGLYSRLEAQRTWWKKRERNGHYFPFQKLPAELRLLILQYALGIDMYPTVVHTRDSTQKIIKSRVVLDPCPHDLNEAIFQVKRLRGEAMKAAWVGTVKYFSSYKASFDWDVKDEWRSSGFSEVVKCTNPPPISNWLSKVYLKFSIGEYFHVLGVFVTNDFPLTEGPTIQMAEGHCALKILGDLKTLVDLTMCFPNPYYAETSPWTRMRCWLPSTQEYPCWKTTVDWILTLAFPFIKNVPNVYLHGCIKEVTKQKWDQILHTEYAERHLPQDQIRSHGFDHEKAQEAVLKLLFSRL